MPARERTQVDTPDEQDTPQRVLDTVTEASSEAREQLASATTTAEGAIRRANTSLRASSDQTLTLVGALSVGTALGLLIGGSSRFLIAAALGPAALVAGVVVERLNHESRTARSTLH